MILTDVDRQTLPEERSRGIDVVQFVPTSRLDPIMFERSYFPEPDAASAKAYVLLRHTLESSERTAIVRFALREKTPLGALRVRGDVLMLWGLLGNAEIREAKFPALGERVRISDRELELSAILVDSFAADFAPENFTDDYQAQLRELIDAKLERGDSVNTDEIFGRTPGDSGDGGESEEGAAGGGGVLDLMEALRRSVDKNRSEKTAAKRTATRKTATTRPRPAVRAVADPLRS